MADDGVVAALPDAAKVAVPNSVQELKPLPVHFFSENTVLPVAATSASKRDVEQFVAIDHVPTAEGTA